jgi:hypothetical protein
MQLSRFVSLCPVMSPPKPVPDQFPGASCVRKLYRSLAFSYSPPNRHNRDGTGTTRQRRRRTTRPVGLGEWPFVTCPEDNAPSSSDENPPRSLGSRAEIILRMPLTDPAAGDRQFRNRMESGTATGQVPCARCS